ncbi:hypothetical protein R3P38DRAFT_3168801 [Favolaschia claudopus]|uniref:Uncharacterized protein n=1 Tax=Favolaschia claudopus TaxID=2862362 RepID=A0AAW0E0L7_9AGAR
MLSNSQQHLFLLIHHVRPPITSALSLPCRCFVCCSLSASYVDYIYANTALNAARSLEFDDGLAFVTSSNQHINPRYLGPSPIQLFLFHAYALRQQAAMTSNSRWTPTTAPEGESVPAFHEVVTRRDGETERMSPSSGAGGGRAESIVLDVSSARANCQPASSSTLSLPSSHLPYPRSPPHPRQPHSASTPTDATPAEDESESDSDHPSFATAWEHATSSQAGSAART